MTIDKDKLSDLQERIQDRREKANQYTVEKCIQSVKIVDRRTPAKLSANLYNELRDDDMPHSKTVVNYINTASSWPDVREQILHD